MFTKAQLNTVSLKDLRETAVRFNIDSKGTKAVLIDRILDNLQQRIRAVEEAAATPNATPAIKAVVTKIKSIPSTLTTQATLASPSTSNPRTVPITQVTDIESRLRILSVSENEKVFKGTFDDKPFKTTLVPKGKTKSPIVCTVYRPEPGSMMSVSLRVVRGKAYSMMHQYSTMPVIAEEAYMICCYIHKKYVLPSTKVDVYKHDIDTYINETAFWDEYK